MRCAEDARVTIAIHVSIGASHACHAGHLTGPFQHHLVLRRSIIAQPFK